MGFAITYVLICEVFIHPLEDLSVRTFRRPTNNLEVTQLSAMFG